MSKNKFIQILTLLWELALRVVMCICLWYGVYELAIFLVLLLILFEMEKAPVMEEE